MPEVRPPVSEHRIAAESLCERAQQVLMNQRPIQAELPSAMMQLAHYELLLDISNSLQELRPNIWAVETGVEMDYIPSANDTLGDVPPAVLVSEEIAEQIREGYGDTNH
jgi:hypothetical protein